MRRVTLVVALAVLLVAAASDARRGGPLRIDLQADFDLVESTLVCDPRPFQSDLAKATAILLGDPPPATQRIVAAQGVVTEDDKRYYCAGVVAFRSKTGAARDALVMPARTYPKVPAGKRGVQIRFAACPFTPSASGSCTDARPFAYRIRFAGESKAGCRNLMLGTTPLARFVRSGGGTWRVLKTRGTLSIVRPAEVVPALLDRVCGNDTPRALRLGRELGVAGTKPPPTSAFQLGAYATYNHGASGKSNVCVFVWTTPGQPPLRGGVTLTGPAGEQTKAFTTLGGDKRTRVVFTVTERARYVADVVLAGKTAQAAASLGLAPTTSGEFACPFP